MERTSTLSRKTKETDITLMLRLDGSGQSAVNTGIGFLDHMLTLFCAHGRMDLTLTAQGDLSVDGHHTAEDAGIVLGQAIRQAIGDRAGITRYGQALIPMDEALCQVVLDVSGRPYLHMESPPLPSAVGDFDTGLLEEFLRALAVHSGITLHMRILYGRNGHHMIEAAFKALGRALRQAFEITQEGIPSTKGTLD